MSLTVQPYQTNFNLSKTYNSNNLSRVNVAQNQAVNFKAKNYLIIKPSGAKSKLMMGTLAAIAAAFFTKENVTGEFDPTKYKKFKNIPGIRTGNKIYQINSEGDVVRILQSSDGKTLSRVKDIDPLTGALRKETSYTELGMVLCSYDYNLQTGYKSQKTLYEPDGKTVCSIYDYDLETGRLRKQTYYRKNGTVARVDDYDLKTRSLYKMTCYREDGTIERILDIDGRPYKETVFRADGKTIERIFDVDPKTQKVRKETVFNEDGTPKSAYAKYIVEEFDPANYACFGDIPGLRVGKTIHQLNSEEKLIRVLESLDGNTLYSVKDINPSNVKVIKKTLYNPDGKTVHSIFYYDPKTGMLCDVKQFNQDGDTEIK